MVVGGVETDKVEEDGQKDKIIYTVICDKFIHIVLYLSWY